GTGSPPSMDFGRAGRPDMRQHRAHDLAQHRSSRRSPARGLLLKMGGPSAVFALCAGLGFLSFWLLTRVPEDPRRPSASMAKVRHVTDGAVLLLGEKRAALVVALAFNKHVVMGAIRVFLVIVALDLLRMGAGGAGVLSMALGAGGFLGAGTAVL